MSSPMTILLFTFLLLTTTAVAAVKKTPTLLEWVKDYMYQDVMLSTNVKSYTLNNYTGEFKVKLRALMDITASDSNLNLMFKSTIRGVISKDMLSVTKLKGVSAKVGVSWADLQEITRVDGDTNSGRDCFIFRIRGGDNVSNFFDGLSPKPTTGDAMTKVQRGWRFVKEKMKEKMKLLKWSL